MFGKLNLPGALLRGPVLLDEAIAVLHKCIIGVLSSLFSCLQCRNLSLALSKSRPILRRDKLWVGCCLNCVWLSRECAWISGHGPGEDAALPVALIEYPTLLY